MIQCYKVIPTNIAWLPSSPLAIFPDGLLDSFAHGRKTN